MLTGLIEKAAQTAEQHREIVETVIAKTPYLASGTTVIWGLNADEWGIVGVIVGIALGCLTFGFNIWFKIYGGKSSKRGKSNGND